MKLIAPTMVHITPVNRPMQDDGKLEERSIVRTRHRRHSQGRQHRLAHGNDRRSRQSIDDQQWNEKGGREKDQQKTEGKIQQPRHTFNEAKVQQFPSLTLNEKTDPSLSLSPTR